MISVGAITNGVVIDHIPSGKGMEIFHLLNLENAPFEVVFVKNVPSKKMGRKDILKINDVLNLNFDVLGYIDPNITVNIIKNGEIAEKVSLELPEKITDIIKCKNPRCITSTEPSLHHEFRLTDREKGVYRCIYCDSAAK